MIKDFIRTLNSEGESINSVATTQMSEKSMGEDTTSIKVISGITGSKAQQSEIVALAIAAGKALSERIDSTFIFPSSFVRENFDRFEQVILTINRHNAYKLEVLRKRLKKEELEEGKRVAILRKVRELVMLKLSDTGYTEEDVFNYMKAEGYFVEGTVKYVADLKLGRLTSEQAHGLQKQKDINGRTRYVMTLDVVGSSAIPLTTDEARRIAVDYMINFQEQYNALMTKWINNPDSTWEELLVIMETLWRVDMKEQIDVEALKLTDKDLVYAKELSDKIVKEMRDVK